MGGGGGTTAGVSASAKSASRPSSVELEYWAEKCDVVVEMFEVRAPRRARASSAASDMESLKITKSLL